MFPNQSTEVQNLQSPIFGMVELIWYMGKEVAYPPMVFEPTKTMNGILLTR